jgi:hypothetical protein
MVIIAIVASITIVVTVIAIPLELLLALRHDSSEPVLTQRRLALLSALLPLVKVGIIVKIILTTIRTVANTVTLVVIQATFIIVFIIVFTVIVIHNISLSSSISTSHCPHSGSALEIAILRIIIHGTIIIADIIIVYDATPSSSSSSSKSMHHPIDIFIIITVTATAPRDLTPIAESTTTTLLPATFAVGLEGRHELLLPLAIAAAAVSFGPPIVNIAT